MPFPCFPSPLVGVGLCGIFAIMLLFFSHLPLEQENALYSGGWGSEWEKTHTSFLTAPAACSCSAPSLLQSYRHIHVNRQSQPSIPLLSLMAQRKSDGGMVVVDAVGRAVPTFSWGLHLDCEEETGAI